MQIEFFCEKCHGTGRHKRLGDPEEACGMCGGRGFFVTDEATGRKNGLAPVAELKLAVPRGKRGHFEAVVWGEEETFRAEADNWQMATDLAWRAKCKLVDGDEEIALDGFISDFNNVVLDRVDDVALIWRNDRCREVVGVVRFVK